MAQGIILASLKVVTDADWRQATGLVCKPRLGRREPGLRFQQLAPDGLGGQWVMAAAVEPAARRGSWTVHCCRSYRPLGVNQ